MVGTMIDLGGKRINKRGAFLAPENINSKWCYINLERSTQPDIFADIEFLPLSKETANVILCTEVLEHVSRPQECVNEIWRILEPKGIAFVSTPFLFPIHADPYDFQRFTEEGLKYLFRNFCNIQIFPMGGYLGTIGMFIDIGLAGITGQSLDKKITRRLLRSLAHFLYQADLQHSTKNTPAWNKFTTGYFVVAKK